MCARETVIPNRTKRKVTLVFFCFFSSSEKTAEYPPRPPPAPYGMMYPPQPMMGMMMYPPPMPYGIQFAPQMPFAPPQAAQMAQLPPFAGPVPPELEQLPLHLAGVFCQRPTTGRDFVVIPLVFERSG